MCGSFACLMPPLCGACQAPEEDADTMGLKSQTAVSRPVGAGNPALVLWKSSWLMLWITERVSPAPNTFSLAVKVSQPKGRNDIVRWSPSPISRASCILNSNRGAIELHTQPYRIIKKAAFKHTSLWICSFTPHPHIFFLLVDGMWYNPLQLKKK